ncbi:MAG: hypothetical protein ACRCVJ_18490 [Clostridium sp.]|uniref:hypothetical protein n=1 Tax=Clostridium sp. TaxID=1506 RepID=UPI003F328DC5
MSFITKQPNGLYCRHSTVTDCVTHYNMKREDYLNNVTKTIKDREDGIDTLENYLQPFEMVKDKFRNNNMTEERFEEVVKEMSIPSNEGYKMT